MTSTCCLLRHLCRDARARGPAFRAHDPGDARPGRRTRCDRAGHGPGGARTRRGVGPCAPEEQRTLLEARAPRDCPDEDRLVAPQALAAFARIAAESGHCFESFAQAATVRDVLQRNVTRGAGEQSQGRGARGSRATLDPHRGYAGHRRRAVVGPDEPPPWEMRRHRPPRLFLLPGIASLARAKYLRTQAGTREVAILRGPFQSWPELVEAGRMLMRLWLSMTGHGVYMLPFGVHDHQRALQPRPAGAVRRRGTSGSSCGSAIRPCRRKPRDSPPCCWATERRVRSAPLGPGTPCRPLCPLRDPPPPRVSHV